MVSLTDIKCGESFTVKFVRNNVDLSSFGIIPGENIILVQSGKSGVIAVVKDKRIALDAVTASSVLV